jgi:serine/threonine-protein kinase
LDTIAQLANSLADRYAVEREIGKGGMATVFLARDLRHHRNVALKVLNPELAAVLGVERFLSEIRVTANLQHPNLLPLFDSGEAQGMLFYVMPFVEGESLRARLERERQLPIDDAIRLTSAIAGALDYAHRHGVVHRDLKPENVLLHEGQPLVADFGIALAVSNAGGARITQTGLSLGTPLYMSPEQATGDRAIDRRADVYSLGAMLYEMLVGDPPHTASTAQAIIAKVLTEKPRDVRAGRPSVSEHVAIAVDRALEKLPADRWATAAEFADALNGRVTQIARPPRLADRTKRRWTDPVVVGAVAVSIASLAVAAFSLRGRSASEPAVDRFEIETPADAPPVAPELGAVALTPDGRAVIYAATTANGPQLYARKLDEANARPISGTEGGGQPMISPDGKWVAFVGGGKLQKVPIEGGTPKTITEISEVLPGDWSSSGVIVMGANATSLGLQRVSENGGRLTEFVKPDSSIKAAELVAPLVLDDGRTVLCTSLGAGGNNPPIVATTLDGEKPVPVGVSGFALRVMNSRLFFVSDAGTVMAAPFDLRSRKVTGDPVTLVEGLSSNVARMSRTGSLVFMHGARPDRLSWIDEHGKAEDLTSEAHEYGTPRLSPDGRFVAFTLPSVSGTTNDIGVLDIAAKRIRRLTNQDNNVSPEWLPDSKSLVYLTSRGSGPTSLWRQSIDGSTPVEQLSDTTHTYMQLAPPAKGAERDLLVTAFDGKRLVLQTLSLDGDHAVKSVFSLPGANVAFTRASPDGRWIAHNSNISGRPAIYVRSLKNFNDVTPISSGGDYAPVWSGDGRHLFYERADATIVDVAVTTTPTFSVLSQRAFAPDNFTPAASLTAPYDVSLDGKRIVVPRSTVGHAGITVITNWADDVRRRLDGKR